ncbi:putative Histidine kinase [Georgfuchsia toluolica]|uniref:histidine kinase n=2 Tax=Georgfuchsia toluolica TaxID=424218 RepID=A0A916J514_9PROT|nr:putative Histidine kinase [Georgfuchsia toluolica]
MNIRYPFAKLLSFPRRMPGWQLWLSTLVSSLVISEAIVMLMEGLLLGRITNDYLLTGVAISILVASLLAATILYSRDQIRMLAADLAATLQAVPDLLFELGEDGEYINVWARDPALLAAHKNILLGHSVSEILPPEAAKTVMSAIAEAQKDGYSAGQVIQLKLPEGDRWFELSTSPKATNGSSSKRFIMLSRDITERRHAEESVRDSAEQLRTIFEGAIDGILVADIETRKFLFGNPEICRMLGYRPEEIIHLGIADIHPKDEQPQAIEPFERMVRGEVQIARNIPILRQDGSVFYVDIKASPIRFNGKDALLGIFRDITERRNSEAKLLKLSQAIEQSPAATVITDIHGHIEYVNPKFIEATGYAQEDLIGKTPAIIKSGLTPREVYEDLWRTLLSGKEWRGEMQNRRKSGELYWEYGIIAPVKDEHDEIINFIAVKEDITERKLGEEALQQKHAKLIETERELLKAHDSLAEADRLECVGRLAAGVAHEVKNPLAVIRFGVDYLAKQFSQESGRAVLDDVRAAIDRADHVIKDLLDFSRQKEFARRPTNINHVIDNAIQFVKHETKRRNITINTQIDPVPPIYADPDRLLQVLINLLSNAAQAIGQDGSIEVETRSILFSEHDLQRSEGNVFRIGEPIITVDIRDTGPGISADHERKLFEPFFTTKPVGEGTGLGLAVSRNIVIMHKGSLNISNRSEGGASALLMFRVAREHFSNEKANTGS